MIWKDGGRLLPVITIGHIKFYTFPIVIIIAIYTCLFIFLKSKKYDRFYYRYIMKMFPLCLFFSVFFGKLVFAITQLREGHTDVVQLVSGFVFYGGLIGGLVGICIYCYKRQECILEITDFLTSLLPLGQAIGRIGCYLNGCCYGIVTKNYFSVKFIVEGEPTFVFPTWFMESLFCLGLFIWMFVISERKMCGYYTSWYLISYGSFRFIIEFFRGDTIRGIWWGISTSQIISILSVVLGIAIYLYSKKKKNVYINMIIKGREPINI